MKLSWSEPQDIDTLDKAFIHLGFTFIIDNIPGIEGECYVITNYEGRHKEKFFIRADTSFGTCKNTIYELLRTRTSDVTNYLRLEYLVKGLKQDLKFFGN